MTHWKFKKFLACVAVIGFSLQVIAVEALPRVSLIPYRAIVANDKKDITIAFETVHDVTGTCDLVVSSFTYEGTVSIISLEAKNDTACNEDSVGRRRGSIVWQLPTTLRVNSGPIEIYINSALAGTLKVQAGEATVESAAVAAAQTNSANKF